MSESILNLLIRAQDQASSVLKQVNNSLNQVQNAAQNVAKQGFETMNKAFEKTAELMIKGVAIGAVGVAGAMGLAVTSSINFNAQMANVASLMPGATTRVQELKSSIQEMSIELGTSTDDLSAGLYQVISAFGDTADSAAILATNAMAAKAGLATTTDAINLTSAVTKAYGDTSAEAVQKASDLALMTVRLGQTTFPELAASVGRVTPLMKQLGGTQEELFAVMATMTGVTGGASEVSTQLAGALQSVMAPSKATASLMKNLGFANGEAMVKSLGLQGSIARLVEEAKNTNTPLQDFIGSIEGQVLALGLAGPQAEDYKKKLVEMGNAAGATQAAFKEQTQGVNNFGFVISQIQAAFKVLSQELGDYISSKLAPFAQKLSEILQNINIKELTQKFEEFANQSIEKLRPFYDFISSNTPESQAVLVGLVAVVATVVVGALRNCCRVVLYLDN
jgi:TP901 family phage tail tape measure protein